MKQIPHHYNYMALESGEVYSLLTHKVMKPSVSNRGYLRIMVRVNGKSVSRTVHRLIASAYLGEQEGLQVNHKDGDKFNNKPNNLEWATISENQQHSSDVLKTRHKPICVIKDGIGYWYPNQKICSDDTGLPHGSVSALFRGTRKSAQGYKNDTHFHERE